MTSTVDLLQPLLPTGIKYIKHLHIMLMTIDYALKGFDESTVNLLQESLST